MRRLLLLRHAKAERSPSGGRDHDRVLTGRGRSDATKLGRHVGFLVEAVADVLEHGERVEEGRFLKEHADVGADARNLGTARQRIRPAAGGGFRRAAL